MRRPVPHPVLLAGLLLALTGCGGGGDLGGKQPAGDASALAPTLDLDPVIPSDRPCAVTSFRPRLGSSVVTNPEPTLIYTGPALGACSPLRMTDAQGQPVDTQVVVQSEVAHPDGGVVGRVTLRPERELVPGQSYRVVWGEQEVGVLKPIDRRAGRPIEAVDTPAKRWAVPQSALIQPAEINGLLEAWSIAMTEDRSTTAKALRDLMPAELPHLSNPAARHAARIQTLRFETIAEQALQLSGLMVLPVQPDGSALDYSNMPVVIGLHNSLDSDPMGPSTAAQRQLLTGLLAAGKGHIFIAPDLDGLSDKGHHGDPPYLVLHHNGTQVREMLLAVREHIQQTYGATIGKDIRVVGDGSGGYTAMASLPYLSTEGTVKLMSTLSSPFDVARSFEGGILAMAGEPRNAYATHTELSALPELIMGSLSGLIDYQDFSPWSTEVVDAQRQVLPSFLSGYKEGRFNELRAQWRVNGLVRTPQRFVSPQTKVVMYHPSNDSLFSAQNTVDMLTRLRSPDHSLASVQRGDCRESSPLTQTALPLWQSPTKQTAVCFGYQMNDLAAEL